MRKRMWKIALVLITLGLIAPGAWAQFRKYDSRTQFDDASAGQPSMDAGEVGPGGGPVGGPDMGMNGGEVMESEDVPTSIDDGGDYGGSDYIDDGGGGDYDMGDGGGGGDGGDGMSSGGGGMGSVGGRRGGRPYGNSTGILGSKATPESKKYVNLNPETAFGPEVMTSFDFPDADLMALTKHMQKLTGLNLIYDKSLKGKISISAPSPITVGDAWKAYLTALNVNGYSIVKSGAFYKIVQNRDIKQTPTSLYTGGYTPNTDNYVMKIIPLKNVSSAEIARSLRPFTSRYGRINEIVQTNTVIIQDTGANINRLVQLIRFVDVPGHDESLQIIKVKNSSAQEISTLLDKILKEGANKRYAQRAPGRSLSDLKIIAEPRTNSIIAMTNDDGARQLRSLIEKLDVPLVSSGGGQIHVYYLNYGESETLAKTLSTLVTSASSVGASRFSGAGPGFAGASSSKGLFSSDVKITSDKPNNAIVVMASPTDYLTIKAILAKLDIPRDQVYVEGLIMEAQVSAGNEFGISIMGAYGKGNAQRVGFQAPGSQDLLNLLTNNITQLSGLFVGAAGGKSLDLDVGGQSVTVNSVNGLIKAIASDSRTNILSTPQILALDNEEAVFEAGETVPTLVRETAANGSSTTSVKEQKVAMTLKLTPQINKSTRMIKLKINQKVDDFSNRQTSVSEGVGTTTRQAVTTVIVRDKDTVAMGGMMRDKNSMRESKVPLLGDIPVLGWLFKQKSKTTEKVNLLFFLTPRILAPYDKQAAQTGKDLLARRSAHLKSVYGDEDPFAGTTKDLYNKLEKQEKGALFDRASNKQYLDENSPRKVDQGEGVGGGGSANDENEPGDADVLIPDDSDVPNYGEIAREAGGATETPAPLSPSGPESAPAPVPAPAPELEAPISNEVSSGGGGGDLIDVAPAGE